MSAWSKISEELKSILHLKTEPVAFRRMEKAEELAEIKNVMRVKRGFTYC